MRFDHHTLVLLVRSPDAPELPAEEVAALQDAHLAYQAGLYDKGHLVAVGPLRGQDDERLRGIALLSVDPETARQLYSADPAVRAGRLAAELMTWMVPGGSVRFECVRPPGSMAEATGD